MAGAVFDDSNSADPIILGVECSFSDGRDLIPIKTTRLGSEKGELWLTQNPSNEEWLEWPLRILSWRSADATESMAFRGDILSSGQSLDYTSLWKTEGGGSRALLVSPVSFIAQTPRDGKPFCSMALTTTGSGRGLVRGIFQYTSQIYDCPEILKNARLYSGWRSSGWQILVLPLAFLSAHVAQKAIEISHLSGLVSHVENVVTQPRRSGENDDLDFGSLTRKLHECHSELFRLERRAHFESAVVKDIEALIAAAQQNRANIEPFKAPLELAKTMMESQSYDLKVLPKRIESQRTMIFNLIIQRDARLNLQVGKTNMEIADTSRRIAEASMRDSAAMKTIAIVTMIFLPGTTVATFFSMTLFRWNATPGEPLVSSYIWVYFAVSVPLTLIVVGIWYFFLYARRRAARRFSTKPIPLSHFRFSTVRSRDEDAIEPADSKRVTHTL